MHKNNGDCEMIGCPICQATAGNKPAHLGIVGVDFNVWQEGIKNKAKVGVAIAAFEKIQDLVRKVPCTLESQCAACDIMQAAREAVKSFSSYRAPRTTKKSIFYVKQEDAEAKSWQIIESMSGLSSLVGFVPKLECIITEVEVLESNLGGTDDSRTT